MRYLSDVLEWRAVSKLIPSFVGLLAIYDKRKKKNIYIYIYMKLIAVPKQNENNV